MVTDTPTPEVPARRREFRPVALAVSLISVAIVAGVGGAASADAASAYGRLQQPSWAPPSWVFGPVWGVLYVLMAIAAWRVWRADPRPGNRAITVYGVQLLLNLAWSPLFFAMEQRGWALVDIVLLDVLVIATLLAFRSRDRLAAGLLVPYLAWILFATALNYSVWSLNA
ncbi:TspO and MBR like protein OS=Tsukamurella paurometabola (strain ATCC 8368 / DSM / CCUG 35730/ CIP 100753 / JCM 10117 / KCTC 9821 / NBRC 16120 / NCIMB 702349/ NCTC 13040) OX=521096 GN=Tpau_4155 PE=3 SV=1 [Tsukamurella paurometabola]|uniref:TspO and MBR like protein n=1 Tax=Tsukamurella paurometabola (strain ATCC 8368 / DSM 20162 / CCUG 35730 / CIP 100753 / JCM 10117 / KCTC 9821 / NBRC 16120 / NCIMB 702349 / NCTC 13040) TaxID=521096 RepID=D5UP15_TSUPD|nr:TspO/MBR family protein [Tsukamurella paurometabola]ADG80724.1 TspO and MBR like protein [Tsukamurella paurometabola DSM 20162]SUP40715.1 TspO/MBR family [Tsukamurella paurometabola]